MKLPFIGEISGKKGAKDPKGRGYAPTDRARELMGRGFSELDAIDVLRREGFSPDEIDKALQQSMKQAATGAPASMPPPSPMNTDGTSTDQMGFRRLGDAYEQFEQGHTPTFPPRKQQSTSARPPLPPVKDKTDLKLPTMEDIGRKPKPEALAVPETTLPDEYYQGYPTEEYIDYVVQEQMQDINERINEFSIRHKELEKRMAEVGERVKDTTKLRSGEQQQIMSKIDNFTDTINDVNIRISSLEKAFKDTLPALIESVRALCDLVQRIKREA